MSHLLMKLIIAPPSSNTKYMQRISETQIEKESDIS